jgi:hypothetical protein
MRRPEQPPSHEILNGKLLFHSLLKLHDLASLLSSMKGRAIFLMFINPQNGHSAAICFSQIQSFPLFLLPDRPTCFSTWQVFLVSSLLLVARHLNFRCLKPSNSMNKTTKPTPPIIPIPLQLLARDLEFAAITCCIVFVARRQIPPASDSPSNQHATHADKETKTILWSTLDLRIEHNAADPRQT